MCSVDFVNITGVEMTLQDICNLILYSLGLNNYFCLYYINVIKYIYPLYIFQFLSVTFWELTQYVNQKFQMSFYIIRLMYFQHSSE
jgi:hypothetical protein